jgi:hypothetical protein
MGGLTYFMATLLRWDGPGRFGARALFFPLHLPAFTPVAVVLAFVAKRCRVRLATVKHLRFKRPYTDLVYQPMLELLAYLRANGFITLIVSGGEIEFMCPWAEKVYGIPPEQVIGSSIKT